MEKYLEDLLERMLDNTLFPEGSLSSADSVSWKAYREAETLTNEAYIPQLISFLSSEKNNEKRKKAYFILGKIAKNTENNEALQFIIDRIDIENNNSVLNNLLSSLKSIKKPENIDILPILRLLKKENLDSSVRNDAIWALMNTKNEQAEEVLLHLSQQITDETDYSHWYINNVLGNIGTRKSIPRLTELAHSKKMDTSATALSAIMILGDTRELPIFEKFIQEGRNKDLALLALTIYGNEKHIPLIIKRIKEVVSRKRSQITLITEDDKSEIMVGMEFLLKFVDKNIEIKKLYDFLSHKKWDNLFEKEQKFLLSKETSFLHS